MKLDSLEAEKLELQTAYQELVDKSMARLDSALDNQKDIIAATLRLNHNPQPGATQAPTPVTRRHDWARIRASYEAKKREEMWQERIRTVEEQDKQAEGQSEGEVNG